MHRRVFLKTMLFGRCLLGANGIAEEKKPLIAILWHGTQERELANPFFTWVMEGFDRAGLKPGENITLQHYFADESDARYALLAGQIVLNRADVLVGITAPPTFALKKVHGRIPIVFIGGSDPVLSGMIDNLGRREEEITGTTGSVGSQTEKRLQLLKEAVPSLSRAALLVNPKTKYQTDLDMQASGVAEEKLGIAVEPFDVAEVEQVGPVFQHITQRGCRGIVLGQSPFFALIQSELAHAALAARLPMITFTDAFVQAGAFASYGAVLAEVFRAGGSLVRRVLSGERAADIPIVRPARLELAINTKTAEALGISLPSSFLAQVDRFVE